MRIGTVIMRMDRIGRISIPVDFRRELAIKHNDQIEIIVDNDKLVLKKYNISEVCIFCGSDEPMIYKCQLVCASCFEELKKLAKSK